MFINLHVKLYNVGPENVCRYNHESLIIDDKLTLMIL